MPDADAAWPKIAEALAAGRRDAVRELLWPPDVTQDWCATMAARMEDAGDCYAESDRALAISCYEQARELYRAEGSGATSGSEGLASMAEMRGSHLGRKIWLLKDQVGRGWTCVYQRSSALLILRMVRFY